MKQISQTLISSASCHPLGSVTLPQEETPKKASAIESAVQSSLVGELCSRVVGPCMQDQNQCQAPDLDSPEV